MPATARTGLSTDEAAARLRRDGANVLPEPPRKRGWTLVAEVLREPMLLLLVAAAAIYMLLGDPREASLLLASVLLVIGLTLYQEYKSERALQALRDLSSPRARVLRDGAATVVPAREVVVGDVLLVGEGDRIPADARVLEGADLHVDESLLTGESVAVARAAGGVGDDQLLHASTLVVRGRGSAEVVATGAATAVGRIGDTLASIDVERTPLQREMRRTVALFATLGIATCVAMVLLYRWLRGGWLDAVLAGITLAMSNIPEEFPVVLTVFLALGAWRMARHNVLVRHAPAIEALGSITVLCTDKTGTLTENRMAVAELDGHDTGELIAMARLACPPLSHDPMDRAVVEAAAGTGLAPEPEGWQRLREYPLSSRLPAHVEVWRSDDGQLRVAAKGAPETILALCGLPEDERAALLARVEAMTQRGLRVLGAGAGNLPAAMGSALPDDVAAFQLQWLGLIGFADPLRPAVPEAVADARAAGVRVLMMTGDHAGTARAIATQAGIAIGAGVVGGTDVEGWDEATLARQIESASVFARVRPEHKLRLVQALKRRGEIVAMTGDGVNDAPALVASHVGIAMGGRGTDVAREAASIVLLDDNFVSVVRAIRLGRGIYENIAKAVRYILAVHVPITGLALLPLLVGTPPVLLPLHVVFLELIIDPACSIVLEREPPPADIMRRPPRAPGRRLLDRWTMLGALGQGAVMFATVALTFAIALRTGLPHAQLSALAFVAIVAGNLFLILLHRSGDSLWQALRTPNPAFWTVTIVASAVLALAVLHPAVASLFGFAPPPTALLVWAIGLPLAAVVVLDTWQRLRARRRAG
ncbi:cation-translocating P-type ATPase [Luteimonas sp. 50]|uniref:Cation-translocating P-type ATPase n=1 Tax=Cognatiluteimonas sedimenti TaxID=2927791 RepID=A0ABT0A0P6_9GAMM|nr:cation-translocating P-type ATPase [Lysobacter sedimenti]MCJ0824542.1 cation-translocating P-type ATPase [Lysobacter sedimenti]